MDDKIVLLVIDMQLDFFKRELAAVRSALTESINQLAAAFRAADCPIVWVRQEFKADLSDAFLEMRKTGKSTTIAGTPGAALLPELKQQSGDYEIVKRRYSAFYQTALDDLLAKIRPSKLVVCGINSHACVRTTVVDGYERDFEIVLARDATASYDQAHHDVSLRYFERAGIAKIVNAAEIVQMLR